MVGFLRSVNRNVSCQFLATTSLRNSWVVAVVALCYPLHQREKLLRDSSHS